MKYGVRIEPEHADGILGTLVISLIHCIRKQKLGFTLRCVALDGEVIPSLQIKKGGFAAALELSLS